MPDPNPKHPNLAAALCAVMREVTYVQKTGENKHHNFRYASEADLMYAVQPAFARHGLALVPSRWDVVRLDGPATGKGRQQWITQVIATYVLLHADSGERMEVQAVGSGIDGEDKGPYKAQTGALKYALRQLLLVPTGDDPDYAAEPEPAPPVPQPHHPTWPDARAAWCAAAREAGYSYEEAAAIAEARGAPRPSAMPPERREALLGYLRANPRTGGAS